MLHSDFEKTKSSAFRKSFIMFRMHLNRIIQSVNIIVFKPKIWPYVIQGFFNALLRKPNTLRSLEIAVTYRCNSACKQCSCRLSFDSRKEKDEKLSVEEIKRAVDEAVKLGAFQFAINGGEPMLEEERVFTLVDYIHNHHKRYVHLCSNGSLLNEQKIVKLSRLGLDSIEFGFDSFFSEVHDANRIKGNFHHILHLINLCKKYKIRVILNTILTNDKVGSDDIVLTYKLAEKLGCLLQITPCCLTGAFRGKLELMLSDEAKIYFHWLLSRSWNNRSDLYSSLTSIKCPAAREKIGIQPYGDVVSCPLIQITYGNIRQHSLAEIRQEMMKNPFYRLKKSQGCLPSMSKEFINKYLTN